MRYVRGVILALALVACSSAPAPTPGANVLVLTLDTVRADALGAYGGTTPTPHLDRLAREGTRFDAAYTVTPLTIPAHASIFTGMWPPRHGVRDNGDLTLGEDATTLAEVLEGAGYATMGSIGAEVTSRHWGFAQGFDDFFDDLKPAGRGAGRWSVERRADAVVRDALAWLGRPARKDAPWMAWVHLYDAHDPYRPPEPYATEYAKTPYAGEIAWVDAQVGVLLDGLEKSGELDDTWIFVVADHGESLGEHGEGTHGVLLYEGATRVPFLVRPPRGGNGAVVDAPVSLVDVLPTALSAVGVPAPAGIDGRDLLPLLGGGAPAEERAVYAESLYAWRHFGWAPQYALVTPAHTLIDSTTPELYARADRAQATDLAGTDAATLAALRERLDALRSTMAPAEAPGAARLPDSSRTSALEALGYLSGESTAGRDAAGAPLAGLPDPVDRLPVLAEVEKARTAYRAGDMATARATAEAAVAADPGLVETRLLLATVLWRTGEIDRAWEVVSALDAERPSAQTRHLMALLQLRRGKTREGAELLADTIARDPYHTAATETYLQTLLVLEDLPTLAAASEAAYGRVPHSAVVTGMYGVSKALSGDTTGARPLLEDAVRRRPEQPFVHHALGLARAAAGDTEGAIEAWREEIARFPPATPSKKALDALMAPGAAAR